MDDSDLAPNCGTKVPFSSMENGEDLTPISLLQSGVAHRKQGMRV